MRGTNLIKNTPCQETKINDNYDRQAIDTKYFTQLLQHYNTGEKESAKHKPTANYVVLVNLNKESTEFGI